MRGGKAASVLEEAEKVAVTTSLADLETAIKETGPNTPGNSSEEKVSSPKKEEKRSGLKEWQRSEVRSSGGFSIPVCDSTDFQRDWFDEIADYLESTSRQGGTEESRTSACDDFCHVVYKTMQKIDAHNSKYIKHGSDGACINQNLA